MMARYDWVFIVSVATLAITAIVICAVWFSL